MHATAQVIQRNAGVFSEHKHTLVFGMPEGEALDFIEFDQAFTFDYRVYLLLSSQLGERIHFTLQSEKNKFDAAVVFLPKAKEELELVLAFIAPMLTLSASIYLVGEKKAGIASAAKKLEKYGDNYSKLDSAKHCQLWHVNLKAEAPSFNINDWMSAYPVSLDDTQLEVVTIPGVFSFGRLDEGTSMLLDNMPVNIRGRAVDFGCGSGIIGAWALKKNPDIDLELVDINLLALECARETLKRNKLEASVYPSNGWSDVNGRVDAVLTNPPFHSGVKTEYTTTETFLRGALDKMTKHAPMIVVANSFLKYGPILEQSFGKLVILDESTKFRLYQVRR